MSDFCTEINTEAFAQHGIAARLNSGHISKIVSGLPKTDQILKISLAPISPWRSPKERRFFAKTLAEFDPNNFSISVFCTPDPVESSLALAHELDHAALELDPKALAEIEARDHRLANIRTWALVAAGIIPYAGELAGIDTKLPLTLSGLLVIGGLATEYRRRSYNHAPDENQADEFAESSKNHEQLITYQTLT